MKKITLSILMSIAFVSLTNAQVDKLLPPGTDINLNPQVSDITKLKKDFLLKLNEKNLNFNQPVLPKTSQLEAPSFPKSIPETREFSKNSKKDIPSVAERKKRFHNKRRNRSTKISKSNSNVSNYKILNNSTDALTNLYPYDLIFSNDLIKLKEVAVIGSYIDKYTYYEDGTIEQELNYNYDSAAGTYLLIASEYYSNSYDSNGNLIERALYDYNLVTGSYEGQSFQVFVYVDNFIDKVYTYDWDGNGQTQNSIFVDTTGTYITNIVNYNINSTGDAWEYYEFQTFLYNDSMLLEEAQTDIWSQDDGNFLDNNVNYYLYNADNSLRLEVYYTYDSDGNLTPTWREDFFYHEGYLQENILYQRLESNDWDGSEWSYDYLTELPDISRGYGQIFVEGKEYDWNPAGVWVAEDDTYFIYSYTPPATITPNYTETFDTFPPQAWEFAQGDYGSPTGVSTNLDSGPFGNDSDSPNGNSAAINIYGDEIADYFTSPVFDLSGGTYFLNYDVALTEWDTTNPSTLGADDYVAVLVTQDRGVSWTELYRWDANTEISNDGQSATEISMTGYGAEVQFAFYANSGVVFDSEDNDFFIDNFQITSETLSTSTNTLEGFTIYPTIVKEELNFRSQDKVEAVTVFNLLGQKVFFGAPNTNNSSINLSKLRPGIYVVKVSSEGKIGSYKIIKE